MRWTRVAHYMFAMSAFLYDHFNLFFFLFFSRGKYSQARVLRRMVAAGFLDLETALKIVSQPLSLRADGPVPANVVIFLHKILGSILEDHFHFLLMILFISNMAGFFEVGGLNIFLEPSSSNQSIHLESHI